MICWACGTRINRDAPVCRACGRTRADAQLVLLEKQRLAREAVQARINATRGAMHKGHVPTRGVIMALALLAVIIVFAVVVHRALT